MAKTLKPIPIPKGVTVTFANSKFTVKGPLGSLELPVSPNIKITTNENQINVEKTDNVAPAIVGTTRALIRSMLEGVTKGYEKILEVRGVGYKAQKTKDGVQLTLGFSHPVHIKPPPGITFEVKNVPNPEDPKTLITEIIIKGIDKQLVGTTAAQIRSISPPDVYHGKGIRYAGEYVRKKAGKRAAVAQT
jgi:large subunit ribosomal protein L6|uniref:50S ribosomal protein L6 n=1 Tax=candidate division WOR-3 bacterium TaxID=2052148 RepID=A0A7C6EE26_UNCW3